MDGFKPIKELQQANLDLQLQDQKQNQTEEKEKSKIPEQLNFTGKRRVAIQSSIRDIFDLESDKSKRNKILTQRPSILFSQSMQSVLGNQLTVVANQLDERKQIARELRKKNEEEKQREQDEFYDLLQGKLTARGQNQGTFFIKKAFARSQTKFSNIMTNVKNKEKKSPNQEKEEQTFTQLTQSQLIHVENDKI